MNQHFFITPSGTLTSRWSTAFPRCLTSNNTRIIATAKPGDIVWLNAQLPNWLKELQMLHQNHPDNPVVVIDPHPNEHAAIQAFNHGARGYCHSHATPGLLQEIALVIRHHGLWIGPELMSRLISVTRQTPLNPSSSTSELIDALSPREKEVAHAVTLGLSNKEIAQQLHITERTVKAHVSAIFEKTGIRDRLQLALHLSNITF